METQTQQFLIRIPNDIHRWLRNEAKKQQRSISAEIATALRCWIKQGGSSGMMIPEEKDLKITAKDVEWDRKWIAEYESKIKDFEAKAAAATGSRRGAYNGHVTKTKRNLDAMSGNLAYHLDWLKRYKPDVYEQVK